MRWSPSAPRRIFNATLGNPKLYDHAQERLSGLAQLRERVRRNAQDFEGRIVDIGAGTGNFADVFPAGAVYIATDVDPAKISRFQEKHPTSEAHVVDGTELPFADKAFEHGVCIDVSHHLTTAELARLFSEAQRVIRTSFLFVDALWMPRSLLSRALWTFDRGRHPRPYQQLIELLERHFVVEHIETFRLTHAYVLVRGRPR